MELSYQVDEDDAIRYAQEKSGLDHAAIEAAYCKIGGYQGYSPTVSLAYSDSSNPFVAAIQGYLTEKGISSVDIVQDH